MRKGTEIASFLAMTKPVRTVIAREFNGRSNLKINIKYSQNHDVTRE